MRTRRFVSDVPHRDRMSPFRARRWSPWYNAAPSTASSPRLLSARNCAMAYPCMGFHASVLRMSTSTVPWRRSEGAVMVTTHVLIAHHMIYVVGLTASAVYAHFLGLRHRNDEA